MPGVLPAVGAAFFVSGISALVYQIAWQRILVLHSGVGIYSIAMIVAAFMAGLGAGSHLGGVLSARVSRASALRIFAGLELGIAAFGAASSWIYYDWLYVRAGWLYASPWRAALLHLASFLIPTGLMGMSLPFLVRAMVGDVAGAGRTIGFLYGINMLGASAGAWLTPWVLIRYLGVGVAFAVMGTGPARRRRQARSLPARRVPDALACSQWCIRRRCPSTMAVDVWVSVPYSRRHMARERAKTFADRLPPVVPKEEDDISRLSDEMADILYPGRRPRPFRMGIAFDAFDGPGYERAVELARRSPVYHERTQGAGPKHEAAFDAAGAGTLRELFQIVGPRPGTDVLVDGKKAPYARELWLPLFWMFVREGD